MTFNGTTVYGFMPAVIGMRLPMSKNYHDALSKIDSKVDDNGNFVFDAKFDKIESPSHLEIDLNTIPGVVENGIFSQMVDKVIVGTEDGTKEL